MIPAVLTFRYKYGEQKGKSIFQRSFPASLNDILWREIEENPGQVISIIIEDENLEILNISKPFFLD